MRYPTPCNMDHCYYKVQRACKKEEKLCFSDLTYQERQDVLSGYDKDAVVGLACHLAECLHQAGIAISKYKEKMFRTTDEEE